ncbi:retinoic acid receptor responder protein 2-like isoform X1 [Xenopus laevis]|uniref:Retinoic acid receptor responder protein 2-like isoform X1 n=1 Tax=Xenopus laevis TaxID=8355 RepID=A0A8J1KWG0_XENLA|nr:retinoic acid receptor responder protein 2-like isoform X1 [Xenopus laevis]
MKISRTWSLLVALGFIVAVSGQIPVSELSDLQKKAMSLVTEHFYEKYNPTYNFTTTVLEASQEDLFRGIFVRLHIEKQQSNCRRNDPTAVKCRPRRKKFSCLSCFLFEYYSHNVVSKFIHCAQNPGLTSDWEIQCRRVNEKAPEQLPGGYSVMLRSSSELRRPSGTKEQRNLEAQ